MRNLTLWKNEAVTLGGCLRSRTSTGSLLTRHIKCSAHAECVQHSLSEQSSIPSTKKVFKNVHLPQIQYNTILPPDFFFVICSFIISKIEVHVCAFVYAGLCVERTRAT